MFEKIQGALVDRCRKVLSHPLVVGAVLLVCYTYQVDAEGEEETDFVSGLWSVAKQYTKALKSCRNEVIEEREITLEEREAHHSTLAFTQALCHIIIATPGYLSGKYGTYGNDILQSCAHLIGDSLNYTGEEYVSARVEL